MCRECKYFMVHRRGTVCSREHTYRFEAVAEAERLAQQQPGERFYVLEASRFIMIPKDTNWVDDLEEPLPF